MAALVLIGGCAMLTSCLSVGGAAVYGDSKCAFTENITECVETFTGAGHTAGFVYSGVSRDETVLITVTGELSGDDLDKSPGAATSNAAYVSLSSIVEANSFIFEDGMKPGDVTADDLTPITIDRVYYNQTNQKFSFSFQMDEFLPMTAVQVDLLDHLKIKKELNVYLSLENETYHIETTAAPAPAAPAASA